MARARCFHTVLDAGGNRLPNASVYVYDPGTTNLVSGTLFDAVSGGGTLTNPLTTDAFGSVLFFMTVPQNVDLRVTLTGYADRTFSGVHLEINPSDTLGGLLTATGDLPYASAANAPARLAAGAAGSILTVAGGLPSWVTPIGASVSHSAAQSIANVTPTALAFNTEGWDTDTIHNTVTNNSRLTATTAGKYVVLGFVHWANNSTGQRIASIRQNGTTTIVDTAEGVISGEVRHCVGVFVNLAATDYVELVVYQDSGGALDVASAQTGFAMHRVGP